MTRRAAEDALLVVLRRTLRSGSRMGTYWVSGDGRLPTVTLPLPTVGRDEPAALALAMDAGVVQITSREGRVSGIVVVDDVPAPAPVDVTVHVPYGPPPLAGIPAPRSGDAEVIHPRDDHDRDDAVYEASRDARRSEAGR